MSAASLLEVSPFEAGLLRLTRSAFRTAPRETVSKIVWNTQPQPACLSTNAIDLLKDAFGKGCLTFLVRAGGWRAERRYDKELGSIWVRTPSEHRRLCFSRATHELVMKLTALWPGELPEQFPNGIERLTPADQLFGLLLYQSSKPDAELGRILRSMPTFHRNGLIRLAFPEDFRESTSSNDLDWKPWLSGSGAMILDALQPWFAKRWEQIERSKGSITSWSSLELAGRHHSILLSELMQSALALQRVDLVRFIPRMLSRLFGEKGLPLEFWTAGLPEASAPPRLAERIEVYRQAIALPRMMEVFAGWTRAFREVPFFDEGYGQAQWWLADWERIVGDRLVELAGRVVREAEPLQIGRES